MPISRNESRALPNAQDIDFPALVPILRRCGLEMPTIDQVMQEMREERSRIRDVADYLERRNYSIPLLNSLPDQPMTVQMATTDGMECSRCGDEFALGETYLTDGVSAYHPMCFTLYQVNALPIVRNHGHREDCLLCGQSVGNNEHVDVFSGPVHRSCIRNRSRRAICYECGSWMPNQTQSDENDHYLCPTCYGTRMVYCADCGNHFQANEMVLRPDGNRVCSTCSSNYRQCDRCHRAYRPSHLDTGNLCPQCFLRTKPGKPIKEYSNKPVPRMHGRAPFQYGIELEVDGFSSRDAQAIATRLLYDVEKGETSFFLKRDGSLSEGYGFEIVFHPRELSSWYSYEKNLAGITKAVEKAGGKSYNTSTCGLHVHRGRDDISSYHIVKMSYLLAKFNKMTRAAALRPPNHYCKEASVLDGSTTRKANPGHLKRLHYEVKQEPRWRQMHCDRYTQLNHINKNTIELRIFKGNLNTTTILSSIMFFDRLVEFTRNQTIKAMENMSQEDMINLFNGFCKTLTTKATLGKRSNNAFTKVSQAVTSKLTERLSRPINRPNQS